MIWLKLSVPDHPGNAMWAPLTGDPTADWRIVRRLLHLGGSWVWEITDRNPRG